MQAGPQLCTLRRLLLRPLKCPWLLVCTGGPHLESAGDGGTAMAVTCTRCAMFCFVVMLCARPCMCARSCNAASLCCTACQWSLSSLIPAITGWPGAD